MSDSAPTLSAVPWTDPHREAAFHAWLARIAPAHGLQPASLRPASADASFRRYLRLDGETLYELVDTPGFQRARETLTWLEANGYGDLVRNAIVAINLATQGTHLVKVDEIEAHFQSRVREIVRIPYDPQLAAGSVVHWSDLRPVTQQSARELAALVVEGLPADRGH